ncbi:MAG: bifunctional diaminohydroxyphosphoribosylaminopyrimidine deaminase/5-amino-6-(5-phosphoribosylamino)uracil reductase RibD [Alphaproteobacteria bacterium]|nr:bifunctional diaminohydroxyphosphoribosylaminopyrimidine deaminase/5-amino-6-(5-phosphoribosylamino)uracil reductase RibD [Alphaproteobacteria bacterium]
MDLALEEGRRALGTTAPNPPVGAVLVARGEVIGRGYTRPPGGDHAEVVALADARARGHDPRGAVLYVTLEPCCHWGRTPPCTDALIAAGVARVVVGVVDPYPAMQGASLSQLRAAGVEVELGVRAEACRALMRGFLRVYEGGLPEVALKAAVSLDGRLATEAGDSRWITGEAARRHGHVLRHQHDALLVGRGTVEADDPRLTCRLPEGAHPVPVVLDSGLTIPSDAAVLAGPRRAVVVAAEDAPERELAADVVRVPRGPSGLDLHAVLRALAERGLHRVLVEGGGAVHRSFLDAGCVDHLYVYVAGTVLPGGRAWVGGPPVEPLAAAPRFGRPEVEHLGDDVLLHYRLAEQAPTPPAGQAT